MQITSNSFGGMNGKMSNFTLDGANLNNNFGLNSSLPGGGNPISMDAIDEVQMVVAPFDVRQSNFIGGGINAVTKSGTNTFKGTAYFYYTNEDMHGNRVDGVQNSEPNPGEEKVYGFTLGGPIIKDKLFFFANYERTNTENIPTYWHPDLTGGGADNKTYTSRTTLEDMQMISQFVKNKYGYDTGSPTDYPGDIVNNKYLARLDWNINQNHHLAVRFNHTNNSRWNHTLHPKRSQVLGKEQYGRKVLDVVNKSYQNIYGFSQMTEAQIDEYLKMYFPMLDMDMICLIEDWNTPDHKLIGVGISITNMTRALQKCKNGRLWPFGWWHCLRALKFHKAECLDLMLIGILPEYQQKGANALLFYDLIPHYQKYGFKWGETNVEMETNEKVQSQWQYLEHEQHKRRRCYQKNL